MNLLLIRAINLVKIIISYLVSRILGTPVQWGYPAAVSLEPNNTCNLGCHECPAGMKELTRPRGIMHPELFKSILGQLSPRLSWLTLYFQGEPYLSKHFFDYIILARSEKIFVATSTNGHFLDETSVKQTIGSGLNRLIISLDGADQKSYEAYRKGGSFEKVIAGIRILVQEKRRLKKNTPEIILQCLVLKSNEHQLGEVRKLGKELGVDKVTFKTAQFNDYEYGNPLMPETPKYARYTRIAGVEMQNAKCKMQNAKCKMQNANFQIPGLPLYRIKNALPDSCFRMWSSCVITWDGKVVPCCFDKDAAHVMGDINKQTFREIWQGKPYEDFRRRILKNRKKIDICSNCSQTF